MMENDLSPLLIHLDFRHIFERRTINLKIGIFFVSVVIQLDAVYVTKDHAIQHSYLTYAYTLPRISQSIHGSQPRQWLCTPLRIISPGSSPLSFRLHPLSVRLSIGWGQWYRYL